MTIALLIVLGLVVLDDLAVRLDARRGFAQWSRELDEAHDEIARLRHSRQRLKRQLLSE